MNKISVYNLEGEKLEDMEVSDAIFNIDDNQDLLHQVYTTLSGNRRVATAHTKDRSERAGSGKKPWKQKGTGRARTGSVRNPIWRKGGVIFGPRNDRNFSGKINLKMKQKALKVALSNKVREEKLIIVDTLNLSEKKTRQFNNFLEAIKVSGTVLAGYTEKEKDNRMVSRNIGTVENCLTRDMNVYSLLNNQYVLMSKDSIQELEAKFGK